jgi:hypothetical protein
MVTKGDYVRIQGGSSGLFKVESDIKKCRRMSNGTTGQSQSGKIKG